MTGSGVLPSYFGGMCRTYVRFMPPTMIDSFVSPGFAVAVAGHVAAPAEPLPLAPAALVPAAPVAPLRPPPPSAPPSLLMPALPAPADPGAPPEPVCTLP